MKRVLVSMAVAALLAAAASATAGKLDVYWGKQLGSPSDDDPRNVCIDSQSNIRIAGWWGGYPSSSGTTSFVAKYDSSGAEIWNVKESRSHAEMIVQTKVDHADNTIVAGYADGNSGGAYYGSRDAFVRRYDTNGSLMWQSQVGTSGYETALSCSVDAHNNVYMGGDDSLVAKYDENGNLQWQRNYPYGYSMRQIHSILVDPSGFIYTMGSTSSGTEESTDGYIMKLSPNGDLLWGKTFGLSGVWDVGSRILGLDGSGRIVFTGTTRGSLAGASHGGRDCFLGRCDSNGNIGWLGQYGSDADDTVSGGCLTGDGKIALAGNTYGSFLGSNAGGADAFLAEVSADGQRVYGLQIGTEYGDWFSSVCHDGQSYLVSGQTGGSLWNSGLPGLGGYDIILGRVGVVPEPSSLLALASGLAALYRFAVKRRK